MIDATLSVVIEVGRIAWQALRSALSPRYRSAKAMEEQAARREREERRRSGRVVFPEDQRR